jgi:adenylate kinase
MIVIMLGPPGVGKGTQAKLLSEARGYRHVATGDLLRAARREGTELGKKAQAFMDRGELVPDEVIIGMVEEVLGGLDPEGGVILDGFPRTVPQAEALAASLDRLGLSVDRVLLLTAPDEVLVKRVAGRRSCPQCGKVYNVHFNAPATDGRCDACGSELVHRADDDPETVRNRLDVYRRQTEPLVDFYRKAAAAAVVEVDGNRPVDAVQSALAGALDGPGAGT